MTEKKIYMIKVIIISRSGHFYRPCLCFLSGTISGKPRRFPSWLTEKAKAAKECVMPKAYMKAGAHAASG